MSRVLIFGVASFALFAIDAARAEIRLDFLMDVDPDVSLPKPVKVFNPDTIDIWIQALRRPEADLQRMTAETIALAHEQGIPNLNKTVLALEMILTADSSHPVSRYAAARALIALDSRDSADKLLKRSVISGADFRRLVEPALAHWNVDAAKEIWLKRLTNQETRPRDLILAIDGLGKTREPRAIPALKPILLDRVQGSDMRLAAASAIGQMIDTGMEQDALRLAHSPHAMPVVDRLCAILILARHDDDVSRQILSELAADSEPSVAGAALRRLNDIDPALVLPFAEGAMKNSDPNVRRQGAEAYLSLPNPDRIGPLSQLLNDINPTIRIRVREGLFGLTSNPDLNNSIRAAAFAVLSGNRWQGQEQASLLLGAIEHTPASLRLVELLDSPRVEIMVASAWALRKIADPRTIDGILDKAQRLSTARDSSQGIYVDDQVAHLFEACARMRVRQAAPMMTRYIPKVPTTGDRSRSAAIWALGKFHEGQFDKSLCNAFYARVTDFGLFPTEYSRAKQHCVIAMARMKDEEHLNTLRGMLDTEFKNSPVGMAIRWYVKEMTKEVIPPPSPGQIPQSTSFLDPLQPARPVRPRRNTGSE